jgi:hypothetical protein
MAYTATDLANIQAAIAKGELSVEFADRRVTYRSIDDLLKAEAHIAQAINTTPRSKQSFGQSCKGF